MRWVEPVVFMGRNMNAYGVWIRKSGRDQLEDLGLRGSII
jgi:hypothetical protein